MAAARPWFQWRPAPFPPRPFPTGVRARELGREGAGSPEAARGLVARAVTSRCRGRRGGGGGAERRHGKGQTKGEEKRQERKARGRRGRGEAKARALPRGGRRGSSAASALQVQEGGGDPWPRPLLTWGLWEGGARGGRPLLRRAWAWAACRLRALAALNLGGCFFWGGGGQALPWHSEPPPTTGGTLCFTRHGLCRRKGGSAPGIHAPPGWHGLVPRFPFQVQ